jgi:hypothetical protein
MSSGAIRRAIGTGVREGSGRQAREPVVVPERPRRLPRDLLHQVVDEERRRHSRLAQQVDSTGITALVSVELDGAAPRRVLRREGAAGLVDEVVSKEVPWSVVRGPYLVAAVAVFGETRITNHGPRL